MLGRILTELDAMSKVKSEQKEGQERLVEAQGLGRKDLLEPIDLALNVGEVVGVAGCWVLVGLRRRT